MKDFIGKRILIASDSHGKTGNMEKIFMSEQFDALIFCGDGEGDERTFSHMAGCPAEIIAVRGNNDYNFSLPFTAVNTFGRHSVFTAHGHTLSLYSGLQKLEYAAREKNCDICIFGHTHRPFFLADGDTCFINPGSVSEPRQDGGIPTYAVLQFSDDGFCLEIRSAMDMKILKEYTAADKKTSENDNVSNN